MRSKLGHIQLGKINLQELSALCGEALWAYMDNKSDFEEICKTSPALRSKKMHKVAGDILAITIAAQAEDKDLAEKAKNKSHVFPFC
ncbi:MAG TPA: hypothetical protein VGP73_13770 [Thermoanaerobaculia bacterium]